MNNNKKSLMHKILSFIYIFNIYGYSFSLHYKNNKEFDSIIGLILTFITIFILLLYIIYQFLNILHFKNFTLLQNENPISGNVNMDFSNVPLVFGFYQNFDPVAINKSYININFYKSEYDIIINEKGYYKFNRSSYELELEICNEKDLKHFSNFFTNLDIENFYCPKIGQNLTFAGRYGDRFNGFAILEFHLTKCINNSYSNITCKTENEINDYLTNGFMTFYYISQTLDHYNRKIPIQNTIRTELYMVAKSTLKRYYYYFTKGNYITDDGIIFNNIHNLSFYEFSNTDIDFIDKEDGPYFPNSTLIEVHISCSNKILNIYRNYNKLTDIFGNIGGFINILRIICQVISNFITEKTFLLDLINNLTMKNPKKYYKILIRIKNKYDLEKNEFVDKQNNQYILNTNNLSSTVKNLNYNASIGLNKNLINNYIFPLNNSKTNINKFNNSNYNINNSKNIIDKNIIKNYKNNNIEKNNVSLNYLNKNIILKKNFFGFHKNVINKPQKLTISFLDYFIPFICMSKIKKLQIFYFLKRYYYKHLSLEIIIPFLEKSYKKEKMDKKVLEKESNIYKNSFDFYNKNKLNLDDSYIIK